MAIIKVKQRRKYKWKCNHCEGQTLDESLE